jgi:hypothetical protein
MNLGPTRPLKLNAAVSREIALNEQVISDIKAGIVVKTAYGLFSPEESFSNAYTREMVDEQGKKYLYVYGCKFKYYGIAPRSVVAVLQFPKFLLSDFPRRVIGNSYILSAAVIIQFLFSRRAFIRQATFLLTEFNHKIWWFWDLPEAKKDEITDNDYGPSELEFGRALTHAATGKGLWEPLFIQLAKSSKIFLYLDNTYHFRAQDVFSTKHKDIYSVLDTLTSRETQFGVGRKWAFMKFALRIGLLTSPNLRRTLQAFVDIIDPDKMRMTEDDWYWCLGFKSYNFKDQSYEWRKAERKRLDDLFGTVYLLS